MVTSIHQDLQLLLLCQLNLKDVIGIDVLSLLSNTFRHCKNERERIELNQDVCICIIVPQLGFAGCEWCTAGCVLALHGHVGGSKAVLQNK